MANVVSWASIVVQYVAESGASILRLCQAIATFNYQVLTTLFRALSEGTKAVLTVFIVVGKACADIVNYLADFFSELLHFTVELVVVAGKLLLLLFELVCTVSAFLEHGAAYVAGVLVQTLRSLSSALPRLSSGFYTTAQHVAQGACFVYESVVNVVLWIAQPLWNVVTALLNVPSHILSSARRSTLYILTQLWDNIVFIGSSISALFEAGISRLYDVIIGTTEGTLLFLLVIFFFNVIMLLSVIVPKMQQRGLTFPSLWRSGQPRPPDPLADDDSMSETSQSEDHVTESETEVDPEEEGMEFEILTDSDSPTESEGDENDPNAINIELPANVGRYKLRSRPSPSPMPSCSKLSPHELAKTLENERDKRLCVVCQDQVKSVLVLPCKHLCLCIDCAHSIAMARRDRRICPLCRGAMHTVMNVYV